MNRCVTSTFGSAGTAPEHRSITDMQSGAWLALSGARDAGAVGSLSKRFIVRLSNYTARGVRQNTDAADKEAHRPIQHIGQGD
jgi:hypothetical protein